VDAGAVLMPEVGLIPLAWAALALTAATVPGIAASGRRSCVGAGLAGERAGLHFDLEGTKMERVPEVL
jgi:hypothetical protein